MIPCYKIKNPKGCTFKLNAKKRYNTLFIKILILFPKFEFPIEFLRIPDGNNSTQ